MRGHIRPIDYNKMLSSTNSPNIINCYIDETMDEQEEINRILFGNLASDSFSLVAQCRCGWISSNANVGTRCPHCNTVSTTAHNQSSIFPFKDWIQLPEGVKFIHPLLMEHLIRYFPIEKSMKKIKHPGKNTTIPVSFVDYLLNPRIQQLPKTMVDVPYRGMTAVTNNLDDLIQWVLTKLAPKKREEFVVFYSRYQSQWILDKVPLLDKSLHMINPNGNPADVTKAYLLVDSTTKDIRTMFAGLCNLEKDRRNRIINKRKNYTYQVDLRVYKAYKAYLNYNFGLLYDKVRPKEGYIRSSLAGSRFHYSGRAVAAPITGMHYYDEVHLPWNIALVVYKSFVVNHLTKRYRFTQEEALRRHEQALDNYSDRLIEQVLNDIIKEYGTVGLKGAPVIVNRNPSIRHLALQLEFVTKVIKGNIIHNSSITFSRSGQDADGDNINLFFIREAALVKHLAALHSSTAFVAGKWAAIDGSMKCHSSITCPAHNYLKSY